MDDRENGDNVLQTSAPPIDGTVTERSQHELIGNNMNQ